MTPKDIVRFEKHFIPEPNSGCWIWESSTKGPGYGQFVFNSKGILAHRFSYEAYKCKVPANFVVHHKCRNRLCVNPDHLEAVTQSYNILDSNIFKEYSEDYVI